MSYKNKIKKFIKVNYKNTPILNEIFLKNYQNERKKFFDKIYKSKIFINYETPDDTTKEFFKILKEKINIKKNEDYIITMYKKFEVNLNLKAKYINLKKKTNKNISDDGLMAFATLVNRSNKLDKFHKFNFLLKFIDIFMFKKLNLTFFQKKNLVKLLNYEKKLFNQIKN